jgi:hypothetical protein
MGKHRDPKPADSKKPPSASGGSHEKPASK